MPSLALLSPVLPVEGVGLERDVAVAVTESVAVAWVPSDAEVIAGTLLLAEVDTVADAAVVVAFAEGDNSPARALTPGIWIVAETLF